LRQYYVDPTGPNPTDWLFWDEFDANGSGDGNSWAEFKVCKGILDWKVVDIGVLCGAQFQVTENTG